MCPFGGGRYPCDERTISRLVGRVRKATDINTGWTRGRWRVVALELCRAAALRFRWFTAHSSTPSHRALPWADDHTLPHHEVRCAPQQNSLSIGSYGSLASKAAEAVRPCNSAPLPKADVNSPPWPSPLSAITGLTHRNKNPIIRSPRRRVRRVRAALQVQAPWRF